MIDEFTKELRRLAAERGVSLERLFTDYNIGVYISKKAKERDPIQHAKDVINLALPC